MDSKDSNARINIYVDHHAFQYESLFGFCCLKYQSWYFFSVVHMQDESISKDARNEQMFFFLLGKNIHSAFWHFSLQTFFFGQ